MKSRNTQIRLGRFEVTQVANGFTLNIINPNWKNNNDPENPYYKYTYIASEISEIGDLLVTHLVQERIDEQ